MSPKNNLSQLIGQERAFHDGTEGISCRRALRGEVHNQVWRKMIVQWCYNVIDHVQADREIVYVSINILDRFLATQVSLPGPKRSYLTDRKEYEAAVMASLLITLKLQGISSLCIKDLIKMSRTCVTSKDIVKAGEEIVKNLKWNRQLPTAARFAHALVDLLPPSISIQKRQSLFEECVFSIELSVQDKQCCSELPSLVAWMALDNAMQSEQISRSIITSFRSKVARITGLDYDQSIYDILGSFRGGSVGEAHEESTSIITPTVIPDDDDNCADTSKPTLYSRHIDDANIVSMDDIRNCSHSLESTETAVWGKRRNKDEYNLPRSKRIRAF